MDKTVSPPNWFTKWRRVDWSEHEALVDGLSSCGRTVYVKESAREEDGDHAV